MRARLTAAVVWIGCGLWYLAAEAVAASQIPGYRYTVAYISDLGIPGHSPAAGLMNSGFVLQGIGFAIGAALLFTTVRRSRATVALLVLALSYGVGSVVVGVVHGGGTGAERITHIGGATVAIVAGNVALLTVGAVLLRGSRTYGVVSAALGAAGLACAVILVQPGIVGAVASGGWERGAVYPIIAWQLVAGTILAIGVSRQRRRG